MAAFCSQSDLEIALGGADVLAQLADRNGDGIADSDVVADYIESAAGDVRSVVEVKHEPETIDALDADSLRLLRDITKWFAARNAWLEGSRGQAVPDRVVAMFDEMQSKLDQIRTGERRLGRVPGGQVAALGQGTGIIDSDPLALGVSIAGFKRGFR